MALALAVTVWIGLIILRDVGFSLTCAFSIPARNSLASKPYPLIPIQPFQH